MANLVAVVIGLEGTSFGETHVLGLIVTQLRQVRVKSRQMEAGHELVHQLGHQVHVGFVATGRSVEQLCKNKGKRSRSFIFF